MYKSIDAAEDAKIDLSQRILAIDSQLAARRATSMTLIGQDYVDYVDWRSKAIAAKAGLVMKLKRTKLYLQRTRAKKSIDRTVVKGGSDALLNELYKLTKALVSAGAEVDSEEQLLLDDVRTYLEGLHDKDHKEA